MEPTGQAQYSQALLQMVVVAVVKLKMALLPLAVLVEEQETLVALVV
jgi:hypothetical protein